mmetsp:Transcript_54641/g.97516  ORF Transcript_54641/g.97516 Transcript_54641/m.97516 type:complete len:113 (-) Transcript_54641:72-410(-)|eukprot:CAMPEP_0197652996 /NCGR_PEP_ID=MMETSP1338-20131121/34786_1 /TAXON_ID=43686 ORGANISM="Pelagodinium beii, Strain RCC1491" /NCGR_SAMPLE_ID=MMETSP1338 /ASSEMBLY_ACC=CAM_ASM_000754 /LENGTH=112 /DNA_ID=CAMNT_0043227981 /DNA_START=59 /DNA_END=397 /DNA_ORIENTATION=-
MSGDDQASASELRKRFQAGGSMKDDQLGASQLRARHGMLPGKEERLADHPLFPAAVAIWSIFLLGCLYVFFKYMTGTLFPDEPNGEFTKKVKEVAAEVVKEVVSEAQERVQD